MLYYFSGFMGYFVLGYYMHTFKPSVPTFLSVLFMLLPIACLLVFKAFFDKEGGFFEYFWYLSIFVAMMCVAWFDAVRKLVPIFKMCAWGG